MPTHTHAKSGKVVQFAVAQMGEQHAAAVGTPGGKKLVPDPGPLDWYYTVTVDRETGPLSRLYLPPGTSQTKAESAARAAIDKS
jgi:hypothetical protein